MRIFNRAEPTETRAALAAFGTLGLVMCGHSVLETARDALFLRSLPVAQLPWVYLIIAVLTFAVAALESRAAQGVQRRDTLAIFLAFGSVLTASLWWIADFVSLASIWLLYVWTGLFATLSMIHFWLSVSGAFTITQAKRLFGFIGAGALTGAICGSGIARLMVSLASTRNLVLCAALAMLLASIVAHFPLRRALRSLRGSGDARAPLSEPVRLRDAMGSLRTDPYARRVVAFLFFATIASTLADFVFKQQVARSVEPSELGPFFATFYAAMNAIALTVQVLFVGWTLNRVGVHRALAILPAMLFAGGLWAALGSGLSAVVLLKGADGSFKHSLHRTATEVLFVPLLRRERDRVKTVADVVGFRGGQAFGSVLILLGLWALDGAPWIAWTIALASLVAMVLAQRARGPYLDMFRRRLSAGVDRSSRRLPPLDRDALEALFAALGSNRERDVLGALDVLREQGRFDLVPALVLHHESPRVVRFALSAFVESGRSDFVPIALRRLDTDDSELCAALLRAIAAASPNERVLRDALENQSRRVRATAIVELCGLGHMDPSEARERLAQTMSHPGARRAIAAALGSRPCSALSDLLGDLARDEDATVRAAAVHAIAASGERGLFPVLLESLRERALRPLARAGFAEGGEPALRFLIGALDEEGLPHAVRLHVPRSLSYFPPERAAPALFARLGQECDASVRYKILRALGSLARRGDGVLPIDRDAVALLVQRGVERCKRIVLWGRSVAAAIASDARYDTACGAVLRDLCREELAFELEQVFRALVLRDPAEDFRSIHRGLASQDPVVRASSHELLQEVLPHEDGRVLSELARADALSLDEPSETTAPIEAALTSMIEEGSDAIAAIAAVYASELGLAEVLAPIELRRSRMAAHDLAAVFERAARRLETTWQVARG